MRRGRCLAFGIVLAAAVVGAFPGCLAKFDRDYPLGEREASCDATSNLGNCGACGNVCDFVTEECADGICVCQTGLADCPSGCSDLQTDPDNCGACTHA